MTKAARFVLPLLLTTLALTNSFAETVVVPDDLPTIQAGLDAHPDTVLIRSGDYAEALVVTRTDLVILRHPDSSDSVHVLGLRLEGATRSDRGTLIVRGIHVRGNVVLDTPDKLFPLIEFTQCRFDFGLSQSTGDIDAVSIVRIEDCVIRGPVTLTGTNNAEYRRNLFTGLPPTVTPQGAGGISHGDGSVVAEDNTFRAVRRGIDMSTYSIGLQADRNLIEDCDVGVSSLYGHLTMHHNRVTDCTVGIRALDSRVLLTNNIVLRCGIGMEIAATSLLSSVDSNTVGHGADGIVQVSGHLRLTNNTVYLNSGTGFALTGAAAGESLLVRNNIAYQNQGFGLEVTNSARTALTCNDWFENGGATSGIAPGATDLAVDPEFCNAALDSVGLQEDSPLLNAAGCGLIGARGVECGTITATLLSRMDAAVDDHGIVIRWEFGGDRAAIDVRLERSTTTEPAWVLVGRGTSPEGDVYLDRDVVAGRTYAYRLKWNTPSGETGYSEVVLATARQVPGFSLAPVSPNPAVGLMRFEFTLAARGAVQLDVFDAQGRQVARLANETLEAGPHTREWRARGVAAGVYFARLSGAGLISERRFVIAR